MRHRCNDFCQTTFYKLEKGEIEKNKVEMGNSQENRNVTSIEKVEQGTQALKQKERNIKENKRSIPLGLHLKK